MGPRWSEKPLKLYGKSCLYIGICTLLGKNSISSPVSQRNYEEKSLKATGP